MFMVNIRIEELVASKKARQTICKTCMHTKFLISINFDKHLENVDFHLA